MLANVAVGQKATNSSRAKPLRCPLWSESRQKSARLVCPLSANRDRRTAATFYSISGNSTHIHGTRVPMEEPSTASQADVSNIKVVFLR